MPTAILGFLTSKTGIAAIIGCLALATFGVQELRIHHADHVADEAKAAAKTAQDGREACEASLGTLKASVAAQGAQSARALADAAKATAAVQSRADHYASQAAKLRTRPAGTAELDRWHDAETQVRAALK